MSLHIAEGALERSSVPDGTVGVELCMRDGSTLGLLVICSTGDVVGAVLSKSDGAELGSRESVVGDDVGDDVGDSLSPMGGAFPV